MGLPALGPMRMERMPMANPFMRPRTTPTTMTPCMQARLYSSASASFTHRAVIAIMIGAFGVGMAASGAVPGVTSAEVTGNFLIRRFVSGAGAVEAGCGRRCLLRFW